MNPIKQRNAFIDKIYRDESCFKVVNDTLRFHAQGISTHDLEDCIQEVFKIALKTDNIEATPNIHGWLCLTSKNVAKQYNERQMILKRFVGFDDITEDLIDPDNFIDKIKALEIADETVEKIRKHLRPEEFILFEPKFLKGKSNAEIADEIGLSKRQVDMRITRMVKKLRKFLKKP
jgi:RNA polymerase sigma factor (sigma-70 family)